MTVFVWALVALLVVVVLLMLGRHWTTSVAARPERYTPILKDVTRRYAQPRVPNPAASPQSPLAPYLSGVVDATLPPFAAGEGVPWTLEEVREVMEGVVNRINTQNQALRLEVVSLDNITKTVDAYKTLHYEADVQVHSVTRMFSSRMTIKVDTTPNGKVFVRSVDIHNASKDTSGILPALDGARGETYASFKSAVSSVTFPTEILA